ANSCGKVRNPAPTASNPTSSARPGSPAKCIRQDASSIPESGIEPASASLDAVLHALEQSLEQVLGEDLAAQQPVADDQGIGAKVLLQDGEQDRPLDQLPVDLHPAGGTGFPLSV